MQLSGFDLCCSLTHPRTPDAISVRQARGLPSGFLQIPPRDRHPCHWLCTSRCRACLGLSPIRNAPCSAHNKKEKETIPLLFLVFRYHSHHTTARPSNALFHPQTTSSQNLNYRCADAALSPEPEGACGQACVDGQHDWEESHDGL